MLERADLRTNETVLIWGAAGGLGCFAIQLARLRGAIPIAVVSNEEKAAVAQYGSSDSGASLGDILGAALNKAKKEAESKE